MWSRVGAMAMRGGRLSRGGGYRGARGGGGHPPFLKGKEIGLFYKNRSLQKRKQIEKTQVRWNAISHETHNLYLRNNVFNIRSFYDVV